MEIKSIKLDKKKKEEHEECIKLALEFLKLISTIIKLEFRKLVYEMHKNLTFNVFFLKIITFSISILQLLKNELPKIKFWSESFLHGFENLFPKWWN